MSLPEYKPDRPAVRYDLQVTDMETRRYWLWAVFSLTTLISCGRGGDEALQPADDAIRFDDRIGDVVVDARREERRGCKECCFQVSGHNLFLFLVPQVYRHAEVAATLSLKRMFEALRVPILLPASSFCVTEVYWMPPSPNDSVAQTLGKI